MKNLITMATAAAIAAASASGLALAEPARDALLAQYRQQAGAELSAERGKAFFLARQQGGKPDTPSCTTCHSNDPLQPGKTRAGKEIAPLALSKSADRYSDPDKVEKWFGRNCDSVLGRACTAQEKGDFLAFMIEQ